jgi:hypothetical protein
MAALGVVNQDGANHTAPERDDSDLQVFLITENNQIQVLCSDLEATAGGAVFGNAEELAASVQEVANSSAGGAVEPAARREASTRIYRPGNDPFRNLRVGLKSGAEPRASWSCGFGKKPGLWGIGLAPGGRPF